MVDGRPKRLDRDDWIRGALELLSTVGVEKVKIVPLARQLGVTSGSFYWHFTDRKHLHDELLQHWEQEMTDKAIEQAKSFKGPAKKRILLLMEQVMATGMARYDLAIWHWAQSDTTAQTVFQRTISKRFAFAAWMFRQAGFSKVQAETRGRMMVVYMMGESTLNPDSPDQRKKRLKLKHEILTSSV